MAEERKEPNLVSVTTINRDGSRHFLFPADVKGKFTLLRRLSGWFLILIYAALPWIKINGYPAVFIDIAKRQFHFFGLTLLSQDLWVFFFFVSGLAFGLFVVSSVLGRVWCGWFCPYTVFLEHVFRRIERLVDGDAPKRKKLAKQAWNSHKIIKRVVKWGFYLLAATTIAHIFLSYFVSIPELWGQMAEGPHKHLGSFSFIVFFTAAFYFCFAWFREQFCIIMCPYGRFQSALTDDDTFNVMYDPLRGEPRGKAKKEQTEEVGDCVDCRRCVNVCPTGIDIRNGHQLECIGCAACIDACDTIMTKLKRPTGLVRYDSTNGVNEKKRRVVRPRTLLYGAFMLFGCLVLAVTAMKVAKPFHSQITRFPGSPYITDANGVRNLFTVSIYNKRNQEMTYTVELLDSKLDLRIGIETITIPALTEEKINLTLFAPAANYAGKEEVKIKITSSDNSSNIVESRFLGPNPHMYKQSLKESSGK